VTHSGSVPTFPEPFLAATEKGAPPIQISGAQLSFTEHKTVTKADLAGAIHAETGLSKKASVDFVDSILGKIEAALIAGDNVKLSGFGNFRLAPVFGSRHPSISKTVRKSQPRKRFAMNRDNKKSGDPARQIAVSDTENREAILKRLSAELGCAPDDLNFLFDQPKSISAYSADIAIPGHADDKMKKR